MARRPARTAKASGGVAAGRKPPAPARAPDAPPAKSAASGAKRGLPVAARQQTGTPSEARAAAPTAAANSAPGPRHAAPGFAPASPFRAGSDLFERCHTDPQRARALVAMEQGWYPYFRPLERNEGAEALVDGKRVIMVGSNNYLGLTTHPKVIEAAAAAVKKFGNGCTGSRLLNGTLDIHDQLEARLAKFLGKPACQVFSTGFMANLGAIGTLVGRDDFIYSDRENHASILDACRLSFGETRKFRHNDPADLERLLGTEQPRGQSLPGRLLVVDGVFSMGGDLARLPALCDVATRANMRVMVDDAHGIGVMGPGGRGTAAHFGLTDRVDLIMGTFSKTFGSLGGFVAGDPDVMLFLRHHSRPLIFAASPTPATTAGVLAALDILEAEPERVERLWANTRRMQAGFTALGFDIGPTETPIVPIIIGDEMRTVMFWKALLDAGVYTNCVVPPASPPGRSLVRTSYTATHEPQHLDRVLEIVGRVGREHGLI